MYLTLDGVGEFLFTLKLEDEGREGGLLYPSRVCPALYLPRPYKLATTEKALEDEKAQKLTLNNIQSSGLKWRKLQRDVWFMKQDIGSAYLDDFKIQTKRTIKLLSLFNDMYHW